MREILFRGKRSDGCGWMYGDYEHFRAAGVLRVYISEWGKEMHDVVPETVGQYTGLTDKNGKKIFEGDIIRSWYARKGLDDYICVEQVVFNQGVFMAYSAENTAKWWAHLPHNDGCKSLDNVFLREVEVIGNIHDNPEQLEGIE